MRNFMIFSSLQEQPVSINLSAITYVTGLPKGCEVHFTSGDKLFVSLPLEELNEILDSAFS